MKHEFHALMPMGHHTFSLFVVCPDGHLLLQKRSVQRRLWPQHWAHPSERDGHEWLPPAEVDAPLTSAHRVFVPWLLLEWPRVSAALQLKLAA